MPAVPSWKLPSLLQPPVSLGDDIVTCLSSPSKTVRRMAIEALCHLLVSAAVLQAIIDHEGTPWVLGGKLSHCTSLHINNHLIRQCCATPSSAGQSFSATTCWTSLTPSSWLPTAALHGAVLQPPQTHVLLLIHAELDSASMASPFTQDPQHHVSGGHRGPTPTGPARAHQGAAVHAHPQGSHRGPRTHRGMPWRWLHGCVWHATIFP